MAAEFWISFFSENHERAPSLEHHHQKHPHIAHPPPPDAQARPQAGLEKNKEPGGIISEKNAS